MSVEAGEEEHKQRLDTARRLLLQKRLRGEAGGTSPSQGIKPLDPGTRARASYAQSRLWFLDKLFGANPAYHMYRAVRLQGDLDKSALKTALDGLVRRHGVLRTSFVARDGELYQEITAPVPMPLSVESLEGDEDPEGSLARRLPEAVGKPFDLAQPPFMRAVLYKIAPDEHVLLLVTHHIVSDEWSNQILADELTEHYRAITAGREPDLATPAVSYAEFAEWQRQQVERIMDVQLEYWRNQLAADLPPLDLPFDHARPPRPSLQGGLRRRTLPVALANAVEELARTAGVTPFIILLTAFKVLLHRYTGQEDIVVGVPAANRAAPEIERLVGLFLNTIVLRSRPFGQRSFVDYMSEVRQVSVEAFEHQELPLELLVAELQPDRDLSHNPLFQVMFVHSSNEDSDLDFGTIHSSDVQLDPGVAKFDLTLFTEWHGDDLELLAEYSSDLFDASTIDSMLLAFEALLDGITRDPKARLERLPLIAEHDRTALAATLQGPEPAPHRDPTWLHTFAAVVEQHPEAIALADASESISYAELNRRAGTVAGSLRSAGVSPGDFVGVYMERSVAQLVAVIGVLRAGAAYVPLDPAYPAPRIAAIIDELESAGEGGPLFVLLRPNAAHELPQRITAVDYEDILTAHAAEPLELPNPQDPAYAIFTSGSTGAPKGVVISHANLAHSNAARDEYYLEPVQRYLLLSSFAFDSSVAGIFWTLGTGGTLLLGPPGFERDPRQVARLLQELAATHTLMLPALYELVLDAAPAGSLASLRTVIVAGENCPLEVLQHHARVLTDAALYNEYGPTEASVWATVYRCTGEEREAVPIGLPITGMRALLVDSNLQLVPEGAAGELCVAGLGVSSGYLGRPELTSQSFLPDPAGTGESIYRTGDRARLHNGQLHCLGRIDEQIKVRGYRIEPAEVVSQLQEARDVAEAAVVAVGEKATERKLVAYVVPHNGLEIDISALRQRVQASLPDYMVPSLFVSLPELPRSPNGKLDKARLPAAELQVQSAAAEGVVDEPKDELTAKILAIWRAVLGPHIGPDDNFFEVGGHSLLGVSLMMNIERALGVEIPLSHLFEAPTPSGLAERVRASKEHLDFRYVIPVKPYGDKPPIFCIHGGARMLADHVAADQPVYLLFHSIDETVNAEFDSVEKMASQYLEEMRRVQPHGPYHIYGFSYGGMLAYEIAMQLKRENESIGLLALLDPPNPPGAGDDSQAKSLVQDRLAEMRPSDSLASYIVRAFRRAVYRRIRNLWRRLLWVYFRVTARSRRMYRAAAAFALVGAALFIMAGSLISYEEWRPVSVPLPIKQGTAVETEFIPSRSGLHEIELTVDRATSESALQKTVLAYKEPSELEMAWSVWDGDRRLATGSAEDYYYLNLSPHRRIGEVAYVLLQIPMSRSKDHISSFGMRGSFTWARGMGSVKLDAGKSYIFRARVERTVPELDVTDPRIDVRYNRRAFLKQREKVVIQSFAGIAFVSLGILLAGVAWLRKHQTIPPSLVSYRNVRHNLRLSQRYDYRGYPGNAALILPERHPDIVERTIDSWRRVIDGELDTIVIKGAHRHLDLLDPERSAEVVRHLEELLRRS